MEIKSVKEEPLPQDKGKDALVWVTWHGWSVSLQSSVTENKGIGKLAWSCQHFLPHVGYSSFLTDDISKLFNVYWSNNYNYWKGYMP